VCQSRHEICATGLEDATCVMLPWAKPHVPLLAERDVVKTRPAVGADAPIAFVSRMDPWRKGMDRLCAWVSAYASTLPHPAVILLVPRGRDEPPQLHELVRQGLIEWDAESRGAALESPLQRCRGAMLLSRFDGQPRSLREALWLGLPIMCTSECGLDEVVATLGAGRIVRGDAPAEIQAAFESLPAVSVNRTDVHHLFDRVEIGGFLLAALVAVASRRPPPRDYYEGHAHAREARSDSAGDGAQEPAGEVVVTLKAGSH
jgi:glycosyltransferase involved in cell wall biosynthesis